RRVYQALRQLRQSNRAVPRENNSDARKLPVAVQTWDQRNQLLQPRHSFGRRWQRVSHLRDASDDKRVRPMRPFPASQIDRRKAAAAERYAKFRYVAVADQWLACTRRVSRAAKSARSMAQIMRRSRGLQPAMPACTISIG